MKKNQKALGEADQYTVQDSSIPVDEAITSFELTGLKDLGKNKVLAAEMGQKAALQARVAELEYQVALSNVYLKYKMGTADQIDETTGKINRMKEEAK